MDEGVYALVHRALVLICPHSFAFFPAARHLSLQYTTCSQSPRPLFAPSERLAAGGAGFGRQMVRVAERFFGHEIVRCELCAI